MTAGISTPHLLLLQIGKRIAATSGPFQLVEELDGLSSMASFLWINVWQPTITLNRRYEAEGYEGLCNRLRKLLKCCFKLGHVTLLQIINQFIKFDRVCQNFFGCSL